MGRHTDKFENIKMKLFAVLALAVAARQVNQYENDVEIGGVCTAGGKECGLTNTECKDLVCACTGDNVPAADNLNCEAAKEEVVTDIGADCNAVGAEKCGENAECKAAPTWLRAAGDVCQCKDTFEPSKDDTKNCVAKGLGLGDVCVAGDAAPACGGNQECKATDGDEKKLTCQCAATHEVVEGECKLLSTDGSAALYSVATAFMALILA